MTDEQVTRIIIHKLGHRDTEWKCCIETGTHCHLTYGGYDYDIEWSRLDTPLKLVGWVHHLTEKRWMNNRMIKEFIECVSEYNGWDWEPL